MGIGNIELERDRELSRKLIRKLCMRDNGKLL